MVNNNEGNYVINNATQNSQPEEEYDWETYEPVTVEDDAALQDALSGEGGENNNDSMALGFDATSWGGMESGSGKRDIEAKDWYSMVPEAYKNSAYHWIRQQGVLKITPLQQRQKYTYTTVAYIAKKTQDPKTQIFPISDVSVVPHQITFDFYDTTEGRVGVSNAVEKHMSVECDVYLTDLIAQYWMFGDNDHDVMGMSSIFSNRKREWWDSVENGTYLNFENDIENTPEFAEFRTTFLQQHSGWVCRFTSHTFGVFQGVLTDVSYSIGNGETFAKWHLKFEEAIFMDGIYSTTGQKQEAQADPNGDPENSGGADDAEQVVQ